MDRCPHCGSEDVFEYTAVLITKRIGAWGKDADEESEIKDSRFPKTVTCGKCGRRVKWDIAHGESEQS